MKYRIVGADRETGQDVSKVVDATSLEAAEARARTMGVLIERIEQVEPSAQPPQAPIAELAAALQPPATQCPPVQPVAPVYRGPICPLCGMAMRKDHGEYVASIVMALILFGLGVVIVVLSVVGNLVVPVLPCVGWPLGLLLCIVAFFVAGKRRLRCPGCGYIVKRA